MAHKSQKKIEINLVACIGPYLQENADFPASSFLGCEKQKIIELLVYQRTRWIGGINSIWKWKPLKEITRRKFLVTFPGSLLDPIGTRRLSRHHNFSTKPLGRLQGRATRFWKVSNENCVQQEAINPSHDPRSWETLDHLVLILWWEICQVTQGSRLFCWD